MPKDERRMVKLFNFFVIVVTVMGIVELILVGFSVVSLSLYLKTKKEN